MDTKTKTEIYELARDLRNRILKAQAEEDIYFPSLGLIVEPLCDIMVNHAPPPEPIDCADLPNRKGLTLSNAVKQFIRDSMFIEAIKQLRGDAKISLSDAADVIEEYLPRNSDEGRYYDPRYRMHQDPIAS